QVHGRVDGDTRVGLDRQLDDGLCQAALGEVGRGRYHATQSGEGIAQALFCVEVDLRWQAGEVVVDNLLPDGAAQLVLGHRASQDQLVLRALRDLLRQAGGGVVNGSQNRDHRGRQDRGVTGLVVEGDVAAGDRDLDVDAAVGQAVDRLAELPHDLRVLRGAEVQAVGDGHRGRTRGGDVAVGLAQRELRTHARVELRVTAGGVRGDRDAAVGLLVDAQHAGIGVLR